jgi:[protein-PII] uridylyltransferase
MAKGQLAVRRHGDDLTVVAPDRPGLFSRVAGTLALHGLDILSASAGGEDGMAVEVFRVEPVFGDDPDWDRVAADLEHALAGRLAIEARLDDRVRTYRPSRPQAVEEPEISVLADNEASELATVVEVRARDAIGVLYRITRAFADCELDVRSAKVQTLGQQVVDTFYVRDSGGHKIVDPQHLAEIERAVLGSLRRAGGSEG